MVLINYDKDISTIGRLLRDPYTDKYESDYWDIEFNEFQVYKYKKRVSKIRSSLTQQELNDENLIIIKYISDPYVTSFSKEIIELYVYAIKYFYTPTRARIYNVKEKKYEEIEFENWNSIYNKINSKDYKGNNDTKFIARLSKTNTKFTRNQLTYIKTYASKECFSISDIKAILDKLNTDGITISENEFFNTLEKINTLSTKKI